MAIRTSVNLFLLCLTFDKPQPPSLFSTFWMSGLAGLRWAGRVNPRGEHSLCVQVSVALWEIFSRVECSIAGILGFNSPHKRGEQEGVVAVFFPALWVIDSCVDEWKKRAHSCLHTSAWFICRRKLWRINAWNIKCEWRYYGLLKLIKLANKVFRFHNQLSFSPSISDSKSDSKSQRGVFKGPQQSRHIFAMITNDPWWIMWPYHDIDEDDVHLYTAFCFSQSFRALTKNSFKFCPYENHVIFINFSQIYCILVNKITF